MQEYIFIPRRWEKSFIIVLAGRGISPTCRTIVWQVGEASRPPEDKVGAAIKILAATKAPPATRGKMSEARGKKFSIPTKSEKMTLASCLLLLASRGTGGELPRPPEDALPLSNIVRIYHPVYLLGLNIYQMLTGDLADQLPFGNAAYAPGLGLSQVNAQLAAAAAGS